MPRLPLLRLLGRRLLLRLEHGRGRRVHSRLDGGAPLQRLDLLAQRALADRINLARGLVLGRRLLARVAQRQARVHLHLAQLLLEHRDLRALEVALARVALLLLLERLRQRLDLARRLLLARRHRRQLAAPLQLRVHEAGEAAEVARGAQVTRALLEQRAQLLALLGDEAQQVAQVRVVLERAAHGLDALAQLVGDALELGQRLLELGLVGHARQQAALRHEEVVAHLERALALDDARQLLAHEARHLVLQRAQVRRHVRQKAQLGRRLVQRRRGARRLDGV